MRHAQTALVVALFVTSLAACGGGDSGADPSAGPAPAPAPGPAPAPDPDPAPGPAPAPAPSPVGGGSSGDCFNPELSTVGSTAKLDYRISGQTTAGENKQGTSIVEWSIPRRTDFESYRNVLERAMTTTTTTVTPASQAGTLVGTQRNYLDVDGRDSLRYGDVVDLPDIGQTAVMHVVNAPPLRSKEFSLSPGQTDVSTETTATTTMRVNGAQVGPATTTTYTQTMTYLGQESITVDAGTFVTCKFRSVETGLGQTTENLWWFGNPSGVTIRYAYTTTSPAGIDSQISELQATSRLNGSPIQ
ncbi:MAG: hypothetical protein AB7L76_25015 [Burkholderiaceae bacterium]